MAFLRVKAGSHCSQRTGLAAGVVLDRFFENVCKFKELVLNLCTKSKVMNIAASILGLAKSNNGFFKSEKQASFLIAEMQKVDGCIGFTSSGYHTCPLFASWDDKGVLRIVKQLKTKEGFKDIVTFERKISGELNALQLKEIASLKRKLKSLEKDLGERKSSFANGSYNSSNDVSTYTQDMIDRYNRICVEKENQISSLKRLIDEKEKG